MKTPKLSSYSSSLEGYLLNKAKYLTTDEQG